MQMLQTYGTIASLSLSSLIRSCWVLAQIISLEAPRKSVYRCLKLWVQLHYIIGSRFINLKVIRSCWVRSKYISGGVSEIGVQMPET